MLAATMRSAPSGLLRGRGDIRHYLVKRPGDWPGRSASARNRAIGSDRMSGDYHRDGNYQAGSGLPRRRWPWTGRRPPKEPSSG